MKALIVVLYVFTALAAHGEEFTVNLVHVPGKYAYDAEGARRVFDAAAARITQETGHTFKVINFRSRAGQCERYHRWVYMSYGAYFCWQGFFARHSKHADMNVVLEKPWEEAGRRYMLGLTGRCMKGCTSMSAIQPVSVEGVPREIHSIYTVLHEMLHCLGAKHLNVPPYANVMYEGVLSALTDAGLPVLPETIEQVYSCTNKRKWRK
jgi:hypothetical protein